MGRRKPLIFQRNWPSEHPARDPPGGPGPRTETRATDCRRDLDDVRSQQARHNLIAATLGVIGASIVLTIKYVMGKI